MTPNLPGLVKHRHVWSLRHRVPKDIIETFGKKEVWRSLRTRDDRIAAQRYRTAKSEIEAEFEAHRASLSQKPLNGALAPTDRQPICQNYIANRVDEERLRRADLLDQARSDALAFWRGETIPPPDDEHQFRGQTYSYWHQVVCQGDFSLEDALGYLLAFEGRQKTESLEKALTISDCKAFLKTADKLAAPRKLSKDDRIRLALDLMKAEIKVVKAVNDGVDLEDLLTPNTQIPHQNATTLNSPSTNYPVLSLAVKDWTNERKDLPPGRRTTMENVMYDFITICGDKSVNAYGKPEGRAYSDVQGRLAKNWRKRKTLRHLDIKKAADESERLKLPTQGPTTINTKFGIITQCFKWLAARYDESIKSPVAGFTLRVGEAARDQRDSFAPDELKVVFRQPVFIGCENEKRWRKPGKMRLCDSEKFWLPLIGLHTGMRLNEICSLECSDIHKRDEIWFIDITKGLKNSTAKREMAIHSQLIALGLLAFRDRQERRKHTRLFPNLKQNSLTGRFSKDASKWFAKLLVSAGVKRPKLSFHSFRHSFEDFARDAEIEQTVIDALLGHVSPGMSARYGSGISLERKNKELQKIKFDGLCLKHLMPRKT